MRTDGQLGKLLVELLLQSSPCLTAQFSNARKDPGDKALVILVRDPSIDWPMILSQIASIIVTRI